MRRRNPLPKPSPDLGGRWRAQRAGRGSADRATLALACLAALFTACASTRSPVATVLPWLEGRWTGPSDGAQYTETWVRLPSGALRGTSSMVRDEASPPLFTEELSIAARDGVLVYRSLPSGQAQTDFRATRVGEREAIFENPTHDWPTRVAYALRADGTLDITVDGPAPDAGGTRALRLQLRRAPTVRP